jgi:predicted nucleic-acid-binding protein
MMERRLIDTNLIVRHLVQDHEAQGRIASKLFEACDHDKVRLVVIPAVIEECVFVLESFYEQPRGEIARVLGQLFTSPGIEVTDRTLAIDALNRYGKSKLHFVDCMLAATAAAEGLSIARFDNGFKKFSDVTVNLS